MANFDSQASTGATGVGSSTSEPQIVEYLAPRKADCWENFKLVKLSDGSKKACCNHCGKFLMPESNTTLRKHTLKYCAGLKNVPEPSQNTLGRDGTIFAYNAAQCREAFANFVIQEALPFQHFDNPRLTKMIQKTLQPRYNHVSRTTLRRDCLKMWKKAKLDLKTLLENLNTGINLTTDVWSAPHGLPGSYLCVTAHWTDPSSWQMMKRVIAFESFEYPHTGQALFEILRDIMRFYKIQHKVFSIAFDNATNNTNAVGKLKIKFDPPLNGLFYHSRCVAHIINLAVQDGLNVTEALRLKLAFKDVLQDVFCASKRRYIEYMKFCKEMGRPFFTPNWDVPTRWNSTYKMFLSGIKQKETLKEFHADLLAARKTKNDFSWDDWTKIEKMTSLLEVFKNATTLLSGVYYPTSPLVLTQISLMAKKLDDFEDMEDLYTQMILPMREKIVKYFGELPPTFTVASALNPCINATGVEHLIKKISGYLKLNDNDRFYVSSSCAHFRKCFKALFQTYFAKYGVVDLESSSAPQCSSQNVYYTDPDEALYYALREEQNKRAKGDGDDYGTNTEFDRYIGTDFLSTMRPEDFKGLDLLAWWKGRESQFPVLAAMARDILTVQASTVASESCFSLSGRVLTIRRTRLTPASLEMCICLKDHLDAAERVQNTSKLEGELDIEQELFDAEVEEGFTISLSDEEIAQDEFTRTNSDEEMPQNV